MYRSENTGLRETPSRRIEADLVVVGGGAAGVCCAITAAREGIRVALVQDRPVLGGNASSEVRLWMLGATSHMGNNNRWAREGGVIDEIMVENTFRNPEGNAIILDTIFLEKVTQEPTLELFLNTAAYEVDRSGDAITCVRAFCSQNSTRYEFVAPYYCDASGDGIVGFLSGAAFRMGAESSAEFGELLAADDESHDLLGHTLYFYTRETGHPVQFTPPAYALNDITQIPRYRNFNTSQQGCQLWWIEWGGRLDTVYDTERIKWELWKVVYGVWDHIKNSGEFPESETLALDWVGLIPGKRESRRFEGDYMLVQQDVVQQRTHYDAVSVGGWAIDLHPVDGVYSADEPCTQWHSKGVYQVPYRSLYSRNISNLFLAGRIISASHIAFGSTRVMVSCAHNAQVVGMAAALCHAKQIAPRALAAPDEVVTLQQKLLRSGQFIPGVAAHDDADLAHSATISASSNFLLGALPANAGYRKLDHSLAVMLPLTVGKVPAAVLQVQVEDSTDLTIELRTCSRRGSHTPDVVLESHTLGVGAKHAERQRAVSTAEASGAESTLATVTDIGTHQQIIVDFQSELDQGDFAFICLKANPLVAVAQSETSVCGVTTLEHRENRRVNKSATQRPPENIGIDAFEFWTPRRRPLAKSLAIGLDPPLDGFGPENVTNGFTRPYCRANAWVADPTDEVPELRLHWENEQLLHRIELSFDTDFDHPMESVLMHHPERRMPQCIRRFKLLDGERQILHRCLDNHQTRYVIEFDAPVSTSGLTFQFEHPSPNIPVTVFEVRCYGLEADDEPN